MFLLLKCFELYIIMFIITARGQTSRGGTGDTIMITSKEIRNIAVIGHSGEGKTTLCEAMLFNGGVIDRMGKVEDGTTVMDFDELEKAKKTSVYTSVAYLMWRGVKINLIDLPGFYDFEGERHEGLAA